MEKYSFIPKNPEGQRWVIPDIHGCYQTFQSLVEEVIQLTQSDQLFFLGAYIDRGPDSGKVIDYILQLMSMGFQVYPLRGNHEQMLLETLDEKDKRFLRTLLRLHKCYGLQDDHGKIKSHYIDFMRSLKYYYELDDFYLVHAGFNLQAALPLEDYTAMLWLRIRDPKYPKFKNKTLIHGHTPSPLIDIKKSIQEENGHIPLDNGCVYLKPRKYLDVRQMGKLLAFNLDRRELKWQENIEEEY